MRHHNSPDELAKRAGEPEPARKGREFRHYNHPEEVAKRLAAGQPGAVPVARRVVQTTASPVPLAPMAWLPPGTVDNTASVTAAVVPAGAADDDDKPPTEPPKGNIDLRLRRVELLLWSFVESQAEASEFRRLLNNQQAVSDGQLALVNRIRALEQAIDAALADADGVDIDGSDDATAEPPATVPDNPVASGVKP
jgi:hypothetical protein